MHGTQARLTLIGGPTVLIETGSKRLLTDPTFDPPGDHVSGPVTLAKTAGPAILPESLGAIDAVLLSHDQHADNLDQSGRDIAARSPLVLSTPVAATRLGSNVQGLEPWQTVQPWGPDGLFVTAAPARHGPPGIEPIAGDVTGFLIGHDAPGDGIYITGDTVWYEGVAAVARRFDPKLVILFAGSAQTRGAFHLTMDANDAIETAHAFPRAKIIAVHTDGWAHFRETGAELAHAFAALGLKERLVALLPGVALDVVL